jgi:hypothetical protein
MMHVFKDIAHFTMNVITVHMDMVDIFKNMINVSSNGKNLHNTVIVHVYA